MIELINKQRIFRSMLIWGQFLFTSVIPSILRMLKSAEIQDGPTKRATLLLIGNLISHLKAEIMSLMFAKKPSKVSHFKFLGFVLKTHLFFGRNLHYVRCFQAQMA